MTMIAKNRIKSAWTPLSNEEANNRIFEERRGLVSKWYQNWSDKQRRRVLEDLLTHSRRRQLELARDIVHDRVPPPRSDFTRVLPRVISLYIFSFLDPTSLSRASQVRWKWGVYGFI
ncbi:F-box only protein 16-like [Littorina saxatilis]|uniref:F-box only protein 16-like n=1 Tax=Littorina saxatilis TaxID=31220 RepID=UPI0038B6049F